MMCSRCGRSVPDSSGSCPFCASLTSVNTVDAVTRPLSSLDPPGPFDSGTTTLGGSDGVPGIPHATRLGIPDDDATQPGPAPPPGGAQRPRSTGGDGSSHPRAGAAGAADLVGLRLGPRYRILKLLGAGGMGAVYEAWDQELNVVVALKTVRPEVAADPETARMLERRFKQELLLARKVTHRNIVRVHDMGEVDGIKYITMPYLEGEDLATVLKRETRLPVQRVMPIARQVASGLAAAHQAGVIHRDLKPANIMLEAGGEALVMDFGVARSAGVPSAPAGSAGERQPSAAGGQTMSGSVVGTIEYMAPEQARARPLDYRADIYAFGLILYDLLLGRTRASRTESVIAELNLRTEQAPPSPRSVDPSVPEALDRIIMRCIQPDPAARFATTADLVAALDRLDDNGRPLPMIRRLTWRLAASVAVVVMSLLGLTFWLARGPGVPVAHDPVSVLIADFRNATGEAAFERTLEPMLKLALEGAGFISAYDRSGISRSLGVRPPDRLDEGAALQIAVKQGLGVVLSGAVEREGSRYAVSVRAVQAITGKVITTATRRTSDRGQVLGIATTLASTVRKALGDDTSGSAQRFAMETLSATSLDVVHEYAAAMEALSRSRFDEARERFSKAVAVDPGFGLAYAGLAITSRNLDRQQDAEKYVREAIRHLDGMTERERYRTRGLFYYLTGDYQACVKEYSDLITRYAADAAARNNLALCLTHLRDLPKAVEEMRQVVRILPNRALYRVNLALYADYSGDFEAAEEEVRAMPDRGLFGSIALAFAQTGRGQVNEARASYAALATSDGQGASYSASGLADLAMYEGRFSEAARILARGADDDLASKDPDRAAGKQVALAMAETMRGRKGPAAAAAARALDGTPAVKIRFLAARVLIETGNAAKAAAMAAALAKEIQAEPQAYARLLAGEAALKRGDTRQAIQELTEANRLLDTWIGHLDLGRAYLAAEAFPQADSEFERCLKRRGEALSLFLDEEPTFGLFPPVYFYQGLVREGLHSAKAGESFRAYTAIRGASTEDPLLPDARRRAGGPG